VAGQDLAAALALSAILSPATWRAAETIVLGPFLSLTYAIAHVAFPGNTVQPTQASISPSQTMFPMESIT
jgi:hypothetical protein